MGVRTMGRMRTAYAALTASLAVACAQPGERAIEVETGLDNDVPVRRGAAEQVERLTAVRDFYDENGDGFVSRAEAEGYYQRYFAQLDDNNDGRLSRAELKPETTGVPEGEFFFEELVGATEREYIEVTTRDYDLRVDGTTGMVSTRDFDELLRDPRPASMVPRPRGPVPN